MWQSLPLRQFYSSFYYYNHLKIIESDLFSYRNQDTFHKRSYPYSLLTPPPYCLRKDTYAGPVCTKTARPLGRMGFQLSSTSSMTTHRWPILRETYFFWTKHFSLQLTINDVYLLRCGGIFPHFRPLLRDLKQKGSAAELTSPWSVEC